MTLEELSVVFSADLAPFSAAADQLGAILAGMGAQADALAAQFASAGSRAGEGLMTGILSYKGSIVAAARTVAQAAAAALRAALQIHSPSRITFETGRYFDEGLITGIREGTARVEREAGGLGVRAAQALQMPEVEWPAMPHFSAPSGKEDADPPLSGLSITIPLEVDGYRLGVAALEGINRVSQGSGRVELVL
ncbi:MAG: hypothetical protein IJD39_01695 [Clostridia bacterium]|nr:hypothetical protein [Clostridia bacterium]